MVDWVLLESNDALSKELSESSQVPLLIFKHSSRCALSTMAKNRIEQSPDERLRYALIDVVRFREVSNSLAQRFEITHESPQAFLIVKERLEEVKSHLAISPSSFSSILDRQLS